MFLVSPGGSVSWEGITKRGEGGSREIAVYVESIKFRSSPIGWGMWRGLH